MFKYIKIYKVTKLKLRTINLIKDSNNFNSNFVNSIIHLNSDIRILNNSDKEDNS